MVCVLKLILAVLVNSVLMSVCVFLMMVFGLVMWNICFWLVIFMLSLSLIWCRCLLKGLVRFVSCLLFFGVRVKLCWDSVVIVFGGF